MFEALGWNLGGCLAVAGSVAERLRVTAGRSLAVVDAPPGQDRVVGAISQRAGIGSADIVLLYVPTRAAWDRHLRAVLGAAQGNAILWVAYPKLTSRRAGDLRRDIIRALAPADGLDTVAQIAIDADWSALRLSRVSSVYSEIAS